MSFRPRTRRLNDNRLANFSIRKRRRPQRSRALPQVSNNHALRQMWLTAPPGRMSPWQQARALALREVSRCGELCECGEHTMTLIRVPVRSPTGECGHTSHDIDQGINLDGCGGIYTCAPMVCKLNRPEPPPEPPMLSNKKAWGRLHMRPTGVYTEPS